MMTHCHVFCMPTIPSQKLESSTATAALLTTTASPFLSQVQKTVSLKLVLYA